MSRNNRTSANKSSQSSAAPATIVQARQEVSFSSGPIPDPRSLEAYEKILPGAAERILKMAESEALHRREFIDKGLHSDIEAQRQELNIKNKQLNTEIAIEVGTRLAGFCVVALAIGGGVYNELYGGSTWLSVTIAGIPTAAFVKVFFSGAFKK